MRVFKFEILQIPEKDWNVWAAMSDRGAWCAFGRSNDRMHLSTFVIEYVTLYVIESPEPSNSGNIDYYAEHQQCNQNTNQRHSPRTKTQNTNKTK